MSSIKLMSTIYLLKQSHKTKSTDESDHSLQMAPQNFANQIFFVQTLN